MLSVLDQGVGIKTKNLNKMFTRFGTIQDTHKLNTQGVGLGLTICKLISHEFGGDVAVLSKYEVGTIFQASVSASNTQALQEQVTGEGALLCNQMNLYK